MWLLGGGGKEPHAAQRHGPPVWPRDLHRRSSSPRCLNAPRPFCSPFYLHRSARSRASAGVCRLCRPRRLCLVSLELARLQRFSRHVRPERWEQIATSAIEQLIPNHLMPPPTRRRFTDPRARRSRLILLPHLIESTVEKSDEEWKAVLTPAQFKILRQKGTEPAYTGQYDKFYPRQGVFTCAGCDAPLYTASSKFDSGCGWPAFFEGIPGAISQHEDNSFGMRRIEITCTACGGHLGHVFRNEGFPTPTNERHCVNSVCFGGSIDKSGMRTDHFD